MQEVNRLLDEGTSGNSTRQVQERFVGGNLWLSRGDTVGYMNSFVYDCGLIDQLFPYYLFITMEDYEV